MTREETPKQTRSVIRRAYGHLIYRVRWFMLAGWCLVFCAGLPLAWMASSALSNSGYAIGSSDSTKVADLLTSTLHHPITQVLAVFQSSSTPVIDPAYQQELAAFIARMQTFPHVVSVTASPPGQDGRSAIVTLGFDQEADAVAGSLADIRALLPQSGPAQAVLTGEAAITSELQRDTRQDLEQAELLALPLTLLVLVCVFGSVVAALLPVLLATVVVVTTLAALDAMTWYIPVNIFAQSMVTVLGLGLAIDYSLLLLRRFREELSQGECVVNAVAIALATAGSAILLSGIVVGVGFAGLLLIGIGVMTSFALAGMAVACTAALAALTLLPALLSVLGTRVNALCVPQSGHVFRLAGGRQQRRGQRVPQGFWGRWASLVMAHPLPVIAGVASLLTLLALPALALNPGMPGADALPTGSEARRGLSIVQARFPEVNVDPIFVLAQTPDGSPMLAPRNLLHLALLTQQLEVQNHVRAVAGLFQPPAETGLLDATPSPAQLLQWYSTGAYQRNPVLADLVSATTAGQSTLLTLQVDTVAGSPAEETLIDALRSLDPRATGFTLLVGGPRVAALDFDRVLYHNGVRAVAFTLMTTLALLLCMFRSVLLPLKAIVMNILSIGAAYGVLVVVFQEGHGASLLNVPVDGSVDRFLPLILFGVLSGLSMDYEIFLLSRVREEYLRTGENTKAVAVALEKTGGVITNAALLFLIVSGAFVFTSLIVTKELGLGISVAVLIDATIIRCLLVPATMRLLGKWNWWPGYRRAGNRCAGSPAGYIAEEQFPVFGGREM